MDGSTVIGRATASAFLAAGATRLVLTGRREDALATAAAVLKTQQSSSAQILTFAVDITDGVGMERVFAETEKAFGGGNPPDVVINCAGALGGSLKPFATLDEDGFKNWYASSRNPLYMAPYTKQNEEQVLTSRLCLSPPPPPRWSAFEVNLRGAASLARLVIRHNRSPDSAIAAAAVPTTLIQLSTAGALFPANGALPMSAYAASKLAAVKVMEYIGAETDPSVLRVLSIHPGIVPETEEGQEMVRESGVAWEGDDSRFHPLLLFFVLLFLYLRAFVYRVLTAQCKNSQPPRPFTCMGCEPGGRVSAQQAGLRDVGCR